jgi:hypothetical protein
MIPALAGKTFFQDGVFIPSGSNNPLTSKITSPPCAAETIVRSVRLGARAAAEERF